MARTDRKADKWVQFQLVLKFAWVTAQTICPLMVS